MNPDQDREQPTVIPADGEQFKKKNLDKINYDCFDNLQLEKSSY